MSLEFEISSCQDGSGRKLFFKKIHREGLRGICIFFLFFVGDNGKLLGEILFQENFAVRFSSFDRRFKDPELSLRIDVIERIDKLENRGMIDFYVRRRDLFENFLSILAEDECDKIISRNDKGSDLFLRSSHIV